MNQLRLQTCNIFINVSSQLHKQYVTSQLGVASLGLVLDRLHLLFKFLWISQVVMLDWLEIFIKLIDKGHCSGDVQFSDVYGVFSNFTFFGDVV
jgi:hypothetical protein